MCGTILPCSAHILLPIFPPFPNEKMQMLVPLSFSLLYSVTLSREDATADLELATPARFLTPFLTRDI